SFRATVAYAACRAVMPAGVPSGCARLAVSQCAASRLDVTIPPLATRPAAPFEGGHHRDSRRTMADLSISFAGISSPNPFWLASAPPTNSGDQIMRAFDHGWGGAVWKTLGDPIVDTSSRFGSLDVGGSRMVGFNNIELITDRPLEVNLREMREVK